MNDNTKAAPQGVADNGYAEAFYELAQLMGIPAQPISPEKVWREQMLPKLCAALAQSEQAAPRMGAAVTDAPLQAGMSNPELYAAWDKKLPGVKPTDEQISAFAIGVEVGLDRATPAAVTDAGSEKLAVARERLQNSVNWLMHGNRTGRLCGVEDFYTLIEWIDRAALAASATPGSDALTDEQIERLMTTKIMVNKEAREVPQMWFKRFDVIQIVRAAIKLNATGVRREA